MERETSVRPTVDELVDLINDDIGREEVPCPCCGHVTWERFADHPAAVVMTPARPTGESWLSGFFAVGFHCERCGFVRLHVISPEQAIGAE